MILPENALQIVAPVTLLLIFLLLYHLWVGKDAMLVFTGVPLALTGGVVSLWLRNIPCQYRRALGFVRSPAWR